MSTNNGFLENDGLDISEVVKDAQAEAIPPDEKVKRLGKLAREQLKIEDEIAELEKQLELKKVDLAKVSEFDIPELMDELGIDEFRLTNGMRMKVNPYFTGKITTPEAMEWLEDNDYGDIIKGSVTIGYPKGFDQSKLRAIVEAAKELGLNPDNREEVHHSTLKAWIKEMVTKGNEFPRELFNVYVGRKTKLSLR
jgi:hypothetical protein